MRSSKNQYQYEEAIFLYCSVGHFNYDRITRYLQKEVPFVCEHPERTRTWLLPFSQDSQEYVMEYLQTSHEKKGQNSLPGVPILGISNDVIAASPGYDDTENEEFCKILSWISKDWKLKIKNEEGESLALDFSRYPEMRRIR